jgi:hypothetical protein
MGRSAKYMRSGTSGRKLAPRIDGSSTSLGRFSQNVHQGISVKGKSGQRRRGSAGAASGYKK